ncbi:Nickel-transporting ATPase [Syntrophobotulus glycolicus DSM 8271]|uniref:Nickel-transporting ATPase n=1 Tax=Syntrophobotulus glycolicus (strain DSM 8271 / FlGlyR) TaxID=645991 RepID=F0T2M2_SYNGF|nr:ABC transporter ATP-binding protein [Syntrophobotulus glycolicus]ADY56421.1 Nickel-transporting ATPase [Syntrophobotulus glycolicus DSM 8271]
MLKVDGLSVKARNGMLLLDNASLAVASGHIIGLTGASGSGKTTLLKSIMGMLDRNCSMIKGRIVVDNEEISKLGTKERRELCGKTIGFIPQNPMTAFDPRVKIGTQMRETLSIRLGISKSDADSLNAEKLMALNLKDCKRILRSYPGQLSGGMLQRIAVALMLALQPEYILADEPTSALDEDNREILTRILKKQREKTGILFLSHDVDALSALCETVFVMEHGKITETGTMEKLLSAPREKWTREFAAAHRKVEERNFIWTEYELNA